MTFFEIMTTIVFSILYWNLVFQKSKIKLTKVQEILLLQKVVTPYSNFYYIHIFVILVLCYIFVAPISVIFNISLVPFFLLFNIFVIIFLGELLMSRLIKPLIFIPMIFTIMQFTQGYYLSDFVVFVLTMFTILKTQSSICQQIWNLKKLVTTVIILSSQLRQSFFIQKISFVLYNNVQLILTYGLVIVIIELYKQILNMVLTEGTEGGQINVRQI